MPSDTEVYIDGVIIEPTLTSSNNVLHGQTNLNSNITSTSGYKFLVELRNGTSSTITMTTTPIKLQIHTNYINNTNTISENNTYITISTGTIAAGAPYYIGHAGVISGITIDTTTSHLLADQDYTSGEDTIISAGSKFQLYLNNTHNDTLGENDEEEGETGLSFSLWHWPYEDNNSLAIITRTAQETGYAPTTEFDEEDWDIVVDNVSVLLSHLQARAVGDPHITTLTGDHYEFDYLGAFRLFEDTIQGNKIIINGLSEKGPGRWSKKQYIQKLYIQHNQKYILVDMGFRGSPVKVLENYQMDYTEEDLPFDSEAKRYSFNSTYRTQDQDEPVTEDLPTLIRNQFSLLINSEKTLVNIMHITLQNVNQYNLQPCRFSFTLNKITDKAKGCLVDRKYAPVSKLLTIKDTKELPEPNKEDLDKMPELEIDPKLRNIQWQ